MINGTKEEYLNNINLLTNYIKENNLNYDINLIYEYARTNQPVHHSLKYNQEYNPHYRLIHKDLYKKNKTRKRFRFGYAFFYISPFFRYLGNFCYNGHH